MSRNCYIDTFRGTLCLIFFPCHPLPGTTTSISQIILTIYPLQGIVLAIKHHHHHHHHHHHNYHRHHRHHRHHHHHRRHRRRPSPSPRHRRHHFLLFLLLLNNTFECESEKIVNEQRWVQRHWPSKHNVCDMTWHANPVIDLEVYLVLWAAWPHIC